MENEMNIVILAAGKSTRFPDSIPKYLLRSNKNKLMIEHASKFQKMTVVILKEHCSKYNSDTILKTVFGDRVDIVVLNNYTNGPAESAMLAIEQQNIKGPVFIKDCDSFFDYQPTSNNGVCVVELQNYPLIRNISNKSFIKANQGIIQSIIEKQIVSNIISVGGYQFKDASIFVEETKKLLNYSSNEIYISNVIDSLLMQGHIFEILTVMNLVDVGTIDDWNEWNHIVK